MSGMLRRLGGAWLGAGMLVAAVMAAAAGGGFVSNWLSHGSDGPPMANPFEAGFLKAVGVGATATHGNDSVIMCTGEVDIGIEAVYVLDVVTGELKGGVLNIRTGRFMTAYSYSNVAKDLQADSVKNPKYLMVTGEAQSTQGFGGTNGRIGRAVVYIAETNSGWVACYAVPWTPNRATASNPASTSLVLSDRFQFRQGAIVRPQ
ncbi:MAG TPA: hypothetical protein VHX65_12155 [Pirellulales bacterium]|jgi:hypothetical protein|nr:hypothetical protein [Pirellulales bacterium]